MTAPAVVFDCVTFLQALANPSGPAAACWELARTGRINLKVSTATLDELADVLGRPKLAKKFGFTEEIVRGVLAEAGRVAETIADVPPAFSYPRDPKDEPYLNLALACRANYLVTWDNDLLELMNADNPDGQALRVIHPGLAVLTPPAFLQSIRATEHGEGGVNPTGA